MLTQVSEKIKEINEQIKSKKNEVKILIDQNKDIQKYIIAANQLLNQCENALKKLQNDNFLNFERLANINVKITNLLERIYDGEKYLAIKENENPRELRDSLEKQESKKDEIITQTALDEREISRLKIEVATIQESIKNIDLAQDDLAIKVKACKKKLNEKIDEQKPVLSNIEKINKEILSLTNKLVKIKENKA